MVGVIYLLTTLMYPRRTWTLSLNSLPLNQVMFISSSGLAAWEAYSLTEGHTLIQVQTLKHGQPCCRQAACPSPPVYTYSWDLLTLSESRPRGTARGNADSPGQCSCHTLGTLWCLCCPPSAAYERTPLSKIHGSQGNGVSSVPRSAWAMLRL